MGLSLVRSYQASAARQCWVESNQVHAKPSLGRPCQSRLRQIDQS